MIRDWACRATAGLARLLGDAECMTSTMRRNTRMTSDDFTAWRKASYSEANANCVEVAADRRLVVVRDTKQCGAGLVLEFPEGAWRAFITSTVAAR